MMRRDLHSKLEKLENAVLSNEDDDDVQFYEFTGGEKVPILTDTQAMARGLTRCVTLDELIRYDLDPAYELEGQYITQEMVALIAETARDLEQSECDKQIVSELFRIYVGILAARGVVEPVGDGRYCYTPDYAWDCKREIIPDHVAEAVQRARREAWAKLQQQRPELVGEREFDNDLFNKFYLLLERSGL